MDVKRAQKIMTVLVVIPCFLVIPATVAYFTTDWVDDEMGILSMWFMFSCAMWSTAQVLAARIKTLEQEIESLKSGSSEAPPATNSDSTEADE